MVEAEYLHVKPVWSNGAIVNPTIRKYYVFRKLSTGREVILKSRVKILALA